MGVRTTWGLVASAALSACAAANPTGTATPTTTPTATATSNATPIPEDPVPTLRLPTDVHPLAESIDLQLNPKETQYAGSVDIDVKLDAPRSTVWLHGKGLQVARASLAPEGATPIQAKWAERHETGVASLSLASPAPAGKARIHIEFAAPFGRGQHGLYRAAEDKADYVFTQFEAIAARQAFPCFDEPSFKVPFTVSIGAPEGTVAVANTHEVSRAPGTTAGWTRFAFAPTPPLPSYLVAFAVGPFDVVPATDVPPDGVRTRPLPLRAITPQGRGKDVGYALGHTGEILTLLEKYTGIEYPWDKLDIVAVPGKGGAMENAGLVTFGEQLLLMDPATASVSQRRGYAGVMAHELAHQWTGDLVTHAWWDDTWLNEAFATWLGAKITEAWDPKTHAALGLLRAGLGAMSIDSLASARAIRQPIASTHDIENAFDSITYRKGGAVLDMFERWVGADAWQKGLHAYLEAHRFGNATADDFLQAENDASGRDVKSAFHTFLDQPGVPIVSAGRECESWDPKRGVPLHQSRFVPLGSKVDPGASWQIPVCVRAGDDVRCTLLADRDAFLSLPRDRGCPPYVFPDVDGAGYYRFSLQPDDLQALRTRGMAKLSDREKLVYGGSLRAAWSSGTLPMKDVMLAVEPLAREALPAIAEEPMSYVATARDWLWGDPMRARIERYGRGLYAAAGARLGWEPKKDEDDETRLLRGSVLSFLATTAQDPAVRAEAKKRGLAYVKDGAVHPEAVDANLAGAALLVVGEEADRATWDALRTLLGSTHDEAVRGRLVRALSVARDPALAAAARELVLDPSLRDTEVLVPLHAQTDRSDMREAAWAWMKEHYDAILARMPRHHAGVQLVGIGDRFCDADHAKDVEAFFTPKIEAIEGGPRALAETLEEVQLCAARRTASEASAHAFFGAT